MKKLFSTLLYLMIVFFFVAVGTLKAQILSHNFEGYSLGDSVSIDHVSYAPADIKTVITTDPLVSGNKVLKVTTTNYGAAPVLMFVLPAEKTLADFDSLTFNAYYQAGDLAFKLIYAEGFQTKPTTHSLNDSDTLYSYYRDQGASTGWERISLAAKKISTFHDTVYIALGTNNSGATWYLDDITLVPKPEPIVTNGSFESSNVGVVTLPQVAPDTLRSYAIKGWVIEVFAVTTTPVFEIVGDTVEQGNRALEVMVNGIGTKQWDIQAVADSLRVKPNGIYKYSIWAKAATAGAQVNFTVGYYNDNGEIAALRPVVLTTQWQNFTMQFTVANNETYIRGPVHFSYDVNVGNTIYIDNLQITEVIQIWEGPALAAGQYKFLGNVAKASPENTFTNYWTQLTPENAGKWQYVAVSTDTTQWNWSGLDAQYNYAVNNHLVYKHHTLIWGAQQPTWINGLDSATQYNYIETWIRNVGQRYPKIDLVDVVNEPLYGHNPPDGENGRANYIKALGGTGKSGWDWVINSFKLARKYLPNAKLLINEYGIINDDAATTSYFQIINLLTAQNLIDGIGVQGHRFELEGGDTTKFKNNLDRLAAETGLPVYISEFDLGNINDSGTPNDNQQLQLYQKIFPVLWRHPAVKGITLWGYLPGSWQATAYLVNSDGTVRPAFTWLAQFIKDNPTGVEITNSGVPSAYQLEQNYPNPFNPATTIRYNISKTSSVTLKVFDILGRQVQLLVNSMQAPGQYTVTFNAQNLASGIYFYQLQAGIFTETKKLMLLK